MSEKELQTGVTVRPAEKADIADLCRLMQQVQTVHAEAHPDLFVADLDQSQTESYFAQLLANPRNLILVAETSAKVAGYIWCEERSGGQGFHRKPSQSGYINHISVDQDCLRQGIGRALVDHAVAELRARGVTGIGVDHWAFNERARAFFAGLGFAPQREIRWKPLV